MVQKPAVTGKDGEKSSTSKAETTTPKFEREADSDRYPTPQDDQAATGELGTGHGDVNPQTATEAQIKRADVKTDEQERIAALPPRKVYNPHAGLRPRVGGPYLDVVELENSERQRAIVEGREPDYKNMAGSQGVPLLTAGQVANLHHADAGALADFIDDNADNSKLGPTPLGEVAFHGTNIDVVETSLNEDKNRREWDNTVVTSHDQPGVVFTDPTVTNTENASK